MSEECIYDLKYDKNLPADELQEILGVLLDHLGLRLIKRSTPDYVEYEIEREPSCQMK